MSIPLTFADPHPACEGHFPGNPVLPAVALLDRVLRVLEPTAGPLTVASAKFLRPVRPGQTVLLRQEAQTGGGLRFTLEHDGQVMATGLLRCGVT